MTTDAYGYDLADRLTTWTRAGTISDSAAYTYLADGSMNTLTRAGATTTFHYDNDDRLINSTGASVVAYTNDLFGRRTTKTTLSTTTTYTYNASGQLAGIVHTLDECEVLLRHLRDARGQDRRLGRHHVFDHESVGGHAACRRARR